MTKTLLHELGRSISFGRLSLLGKVLWPMLLAASDQQGRGQAEPDVIKWQVCQNVNELTTENIPDILLEMEKQEMIHLYADDRGRPLYQVVRWWEYQQLQWAWPSKFVAPEGWTDKVRYTIRGKGTITENWEHPGGFQQEAEDVSTEDPPAEQPAIPPENPPGNLPEGLTSLNLTDQLNLTDPESPIGDVPDQQKPAEKGNGIPGNFQGWSLIVQESKNRPATLVFMYETLFPGRDVPAFSYVGKVARKVGGAGRLAELFWQVSTKPPTGDVLAYIQGKVKREKKADNTGDLAGMKALAQQEGWLDGDP